MTRVARVERRTEKTVESFASFHGGFSTSKSGKSRYIYFVTVTSAFKSICCINWVSLNYNTDEASVCDKVILTPEPFVPYVPNFFSSKLRCATKLFQQQKLVRCTNSKICEKEKLLFNGIYEPICSNSLNSRSANSSLISWRRKLVRIYRYFQINVYIFAQTL